MRAARISAGALCAITLSALALATEPSLRFRRYLPEAYIPGEVVTVTVQPETSMSEVWADVYEIIPACWSFLGSDAPESSFDEDSRSIHLSLHLWTPYGVGVDTETRYYVQPPLDQRGDVSLEGHSYYAFDEDAPRTYAATTGDATLSERVGMLRFRPHWATIQATIDASEWGDTVMVSADGSPYAENIVIKRGVNLVGFVEWPSYEPPVIQSASPSEPAIVAAPYTSIRGFIISSSSSGIRVNDPTVEISDCVITGTENAAVEYVGSTKVA